MATTKELADKVEQLEDQVGALNGRVKLLEDRRDGKVIAATDEELDSQYGNPRIMFDPKKWTKDGGKSYRNAYMNQAPAEYLEILSEYLQWTADSNEKQANNPSEADKWGGREKLLKRAKFQRLDAAKALGWARRVRNGYTPSPEESRDLEFPE